VDHENNSDVDHENNSDVDHVNNSDVDHENNSDVEHENNSDVDHENNSDVDHENNSDVEHENNSDVEHEKSSNVFAAGGPRHERLAYNIHGFVSKSKKPTPLKQLHCGFLVHKHTPATHTGVSNNKHCQTQN
jgi:hypothetical protein